MNGTTAYPTVKQGWILMPVSIVLMLLAWLVIYFLSALLPDAINQNELTESATELIAYCLAFVLMISYAINQRKKYGPSEPVWKNSKLHPAIYIIVVVLTPLLGVLLDPVSTLMPAPRWFEDLMLSAIRPNIISFLAIGIAPAIFEELLLRGMVLDGMLKNYGPAKAILWSSFFFGIIHCNPWQAVPGFFIGIFLGWVYFRTRSLWPCMLIHAVNNSLSFFMLFYIPGQVETYTEWLGAGNFLVLFSVSVIVFAGGCVLLNRLMPAKGVE
jgi:membrane protease YdiL (CAAX protease family)